MSKTQIAIVGAAGRMGRMTLLEVMADDDAACAGLVVRPGSPDEGKKAYLPDSKIGTGLKYTSDREAAFKAADVIIDFSTAEAGVDNAKRAAGAGVPIAIGITGFSEKQIEGIKALGDKIPVLLSYNMSFGITALAHTLADLSRALGPDFHLEITDLHHKHKKDAPSGTALMLGKAAGRDKKDIKFVSERRGTVFGEHRVLFSGPAEQIEITHRAKDRRLFAKGALMAAKWLVRQKPGFYSLKDVLGP